MVVVEEAEGEEVGGEAPEGVGGAVVDQEEEEEERGARLFHCGHLV